MSCQEGGIDFRGRTAAFAIAAIVFLGLLIPSLASAGPFPGCDAASLNEQDLSGCDLRGAPTVKGSVQFRDKNLSGANLAGKAIYLVGQTKLSSADLRGSILRFGPGKVDLSNADVRAGIIFVGSGDGLTLNLKGANLTNGSLEEHWYGRDFSADFTNANLTNADFDFATLPDRDTALLAEPMIKSSGIIGRPKNLPKGWITANGRLIGPSVDLSGADLDGLDLSQVDMSWIKSGGVIGTPSKLPDGVKLLRGYLIGPRQNLSSLDLHDLDFNGVDLGGSLLSETNLEGAALKDARLAGVVLLSVGGIPSSLPEGWVSRNTRNSSDSPVNVLVGPNAYLIGTRLDGMDLSVADLTGVRTYSLTGTPAALPIGWVVRDGHLVGPGANLLSARFTDLAGLDLTGASLKNADLTRASLDGTNLTGVVLDGANLTGAQLSGVVGGADLISPAGPILVIGRPSSIPSSWTLFCSSRSCLIFLGANARMDLQALRDVAFQMQGKTPGAAGFDIGAFKEVLSVIFVVLRNRDMTNSNLESASLEGADLSGSNLSASNLSGVDAGGIAVPVDSGSTASIAAVKKSGAKLFRTKLTGSNINKAKLKYAGLAGVISGGLKGTPLTLPTGWIYAAGCLIGPKANLTSANLTKVDFKTTSLNGTILTKANVTGANLSKASLTGVISSGLIGKPSSLPKGWKISKGSFAKG